MYAMHVQSWFLKHIQAIKFSTRLLILRHIFFWVLKCAHTSTRLDKKIHQAIISLYKTSWFCWNHIRWSYLPMKTLRLSWRLCCLILCYAIKFHYYSLYTNIRGFRCSGRDRSSCPSCDTRRVIVILYLIFGFYVCLYFFVYLSFYSFSIVWFVWNRYKLHYLSFQHFDYEPTCKLFQKRVVCNKFEIYVFIYSCNYYHFLEGPSWSISYGSWVYDYLDNQCQSPLMLWVRIPLKRGVLDTTLCDKVCQWLVAGRWFSPCTDVSFTNKTDRHDIAAILLKVALDTIT